MRKSLFNIVLLLITLSIVGCDGGDTGSTLDNTNNSPINTDTTPTISGSPNLVSREGEAYLFVPFATDAKNSNLTFSVQNKPVWMRFTPETGELSGTPTSDDVGYHGEIRISVTDGKSTTSLNSFSITVTSTSATLSWVAPMTRTDNTSIQMDKIGGYKVYMGTNANALNQVAEISDPYLMVYKISNLSNGTYYFSVTSFDQNGSESAQSEIVSKTII